MRCWLGAPSNPGTSPGEGVVADPQEKEASGLQNPQRWYLRFMAVGACYCDRCQEPVEPVYLQPRLRKYARFYFLVPIPFVPFLPIISSDYFVMIPLTMLYLLGVGPALGWLTQKPTCPECGAFVRAQR